MIWIMPVYYKEFLHSSIFLSIPIKYKYITQCFYDLKYTYLIQIINSDIYDFKYSNQN